MKRLLALSLSTAMLAGCSSPSLNPATDAHLTGSARNEAALKLVAVGGSDQEMDKFFSGTRELKNACIVGVHNETIVNDNTANYKSTTDINMGAGWAQRHTFTLTYDFEPAPAYFQGFTDYAYEALETTLKNYGYNVIPLDTIKAAPSYIAHGDNGKTNYDKTPQYNSGYYHLDAKGLRNYSGKGFSNIRLLTANDDWATKFHSETNCELIVNVDMNSYWKVKGSGQAESITALMMTSQTNISLGFFVPWSVWKKASKEIDKKIYGAINRGGTTHLKDAVKSELLYATGDLSKADPTHLQNLAKNTENTILNTITAGIEFQIRAFHTEVYTKKRVPNETRTAASAGE